MRFKAWLAKSKHSWKIHYYHNSYLYDGAIILAIILAVSINIRDDINAIEREIVKAELHIEEK